MTRDTTRPAALFDYGVAWDWSFSLTIPPPPVPSHRRDRRVGHRICPGVNFELAAVDTKLANLVYCFNWQLPKEMQEKDVDMTEVFGVTLHRKEKLMLLPKPPRTTAGDRW